MNVIFMGTPDFAVPTLQMLIDQNYNIQAVVTQPDKPKGRGKKEAMPPVKELALKYNIPVLQPNQVKGDEEFYNHIKTLNPDLIVVVAFGQLLPESILNIPRLGCINIHGSLLPKLRGAAPIQWSIINQEPVTGVTIMYMDKGMDTGAMLLKKEIPIEADETYYTLHEKMKDIGAKALLEAMPDIERGGINREQQKNEDATYAPIISKELGHVQWNKTAKEIDALIRGLNPWPVAFTYYNGEPMKIWKARVYDEVKEGVSGTILEVSKNGILVQTGKGIILIEEIQFPNKKRMHVAEYIKGNKIEVDEILGI
jgi:methionyl-tRNA formyltransferase